MDIASASHTRWVERNFPGLEGVIYLASAGRAPIPQVSQREMRRAYHEAFEDVNSVIDESLYLKNFRKQAARLINARTDEIAFTTSTTAGINQFANSVNWRRGDKVLVPDLEYPSNVIPWERVAKEKGARVLGIRSVNGLVPIEEIERRLDDRTKVLAISLVEFSTGQRFPLQRLSEACREHGTLLFLDAVQALGAIDVDTSKADIAGLSAGGYKWLCGPLGSGLLYVSRRHADELEPKTIHWQSIRDSDRGYYWRKVVAGGCMTDAKARPTQDASAFEFSPEEVVQIAGLTASLRFLADLGPSSIEKRIALLNDRALVLLDMLGFNVLTPRNAEERAGIMSFYPKRRISDLKEADRIASRLGRVKLVVRGGMFRCAAHFFNSRDDIDRALSRTASACRKMDLL